MATRCVSLDGDADRLVYFSLTDGAAMQLFDGDKIAALMASYICDLLRALPHCELRNASVRSLVCFEESFRLDASEEAALTPLAWWAPSGGGGADSVRERRIHAIPHQDTGTACSQDGHRRQAPAQGSGGV